MRKTTESDRPKQKTEWKFDAELPSGQRVRVKIKQDMETIERKVKVEAGMRIKSRPRSKVPGTHKEAPNYPVQLYTNLRDKHGKFVTRPMKVQGLRISMRFQNGTELEARSCCKPPDIFSAHIARRKAIHRIFLLDSGINPANLKYEEITAIGGGTNRCLVRAKGHKPLLDGEDRKYLFYLVLRNGKLRSKKETDTSQKTKADLRQVAKEAIG